MNGNNSFFILFGKEDAMTKSLKAILTTAILTMILIFAGCSDSDDSSSPTNHVTITEKPMYYEVNIDYSSGDRYSIGREYGTKVLSLVPSYEAGSDAYVAASVAGLQQQDPEITYEVIIERALEIYKNIQSQYKDEIEGFASVLSGGTVNIMGDGKLSRDEFVVLNFLGDVCTPISCSATAVFGSKSATGQAIVGRNLDWSTSTGPPTASTNDNTEAAAKTAAVFYLKTGEKQVVSFGSLGWIGIITGINSDGIFVANLYSEIGAPYSAVGKSSVMLDIREALETSSTVDEVGAFLGDPSRLYAYHNNMFIADKNTAKVLENDYERNRALRSFDSELNPGITWGISDAIACVNAFVLKGNFDNFTKNKGNTLRWASFEALLKEGDTVNIDQVRTIMSYHEGFIYNQGTIVSMAYSFSENRLELWFGTYVDDPQYETISIPFLENQ